MGLLTVQTGTFKIGIGQGFLVCQRRRPCFCPSEKSQRKLPSFLRRTRRIQAACHPRRIYRIVQRLYRRPQKRNRNHSRHLNVANVCWRTTTQQEIRAAGEDAAITDRIRGILRGVASPLKAMRVVIGNNGDFISVDSAGEIGKFQQRQTEKLMFRHDDRIKKATTR